MKYLLSILALFGSNALADDLFTINSEAMTDLAREALLAQEPQLADSELKMTAIMIMCNGPASEDCMSTVELALSAQVSVTKQRDLCLTKTEYSTMQVQMQPTGNAVVKGEYKDRGTSTSTRIDACTPADLEKVK